MRLPLLVIYLFVATSAFAQHAYWRVNMTTGGGGGAALAAIDLIAFFDSGNTLIPTTGGTASASSTNGGFVPGNAFDGTINNSWWVSSVDPAVTPQWIQYQFSSPVSVDHFTYAPRQSFASQWPTDVNLQYSDDGVNFTYVYYFYGLGFPGNNGGSAPNQYWSLSSSNASPTLVVAYRILITSTDGVAYTSISHVEFTNCTGSPITTTLLAAPSSSVQSINSNSTGGGMNAFDTYVATKAWDSYGVPSGGSPQWLEYIFGGLTPISQVIITPRNAGSETQGPHNFSVQSSPDGTNWTTLNSFTAATWVAGTAQTFTVTNACAAPTQISAFLTRP